MFFLLGSSQLPFQRQLWKGCMVCVHYMKPDLLDTHPPLSSSPNTHIENSNPHWSLLNLEI